MGPRNLSPKQVCICAAQVPFVRGGAEILTEALRDSLRQAGYACEIVQLPFKWYPNERNLDACLAWRLLDLTEADGKRIDSVLCTKFPSYVVSHPNKVIWLYHQFRDIYDLWGSPYSLFKQTDGDAKIREQLVGIDRMALSEAKKLFAISQNVANRLERSTGLKAEVLYPPPRHENAYYCENYGDFVLFVSRLEPKKRLMELLEAMRLVQTPLRCVVMGEGPLYNQAKQFTVLQGLSEKVSFRGFVLEEELVQLYANCCCVFFGPLDEDYGLVTLEAFRSHKPVVTFADSGGVLEFVRHGVNGFILEKDPAVLAACLDELYAARHVCRQLGEAGFESIRDITWKATIGRLAQAL